MFTLFKTLSYNLTLISSLFADGIQAMHWLIILDQFIEILETREKHLSDDMNIDDYIEISDIIAQKLFLPPSLSTILNLEFNEDKTIRLLTKLRNLRGDIHDDFCEITDVPSIAEFEMTNEFMDLYLDKLLQWKKDQGKRHYSKQNQLFVEEFEKEKLNFIL